jgi:UDP-glucose 4-epimerase
LDNNILITGARGFVGKNLTEHLSTKSHESCKIFGPSHKELELLYADKVLQYILDNKIGTIIHTANIGGTRKTGYDPDKTDVVTNNLRMFFNLTRALPYINRMIFLGSGAEYDRQNYTPKMKEEYFDKHVPNDAYGFSKYACSKVIENSSKIINLRLFGVFGKYEDHEFKFISNSILKNLFGLPIVINQNVSFDYLYINDCIDLISKFISNKPKHKFYNLVTGRTIDLVSIANEINNIAANKSEILINNPGMNTEYSGDNSRLLKEIKYEFTPFKEALKELYLYYKSVLHTIDENKIKTDEYIKFCKTKNSL